MAPHSNPPTKAGLRQLREPSLNWEVLGPPAPQRLWTPVRSDLSVRGAGASPLALSPRPY